MITYFTLRSSCPPGWTQVAEGQLVVAVTDGKSVGVSVGSPLGDKEDRTHAHQITGSVTLQQDTISAAGGSNNQGACHDTYPISGTANESTSQLPFAQLLLCQINKEDSNPVPFGSVAFFMNSTCPTNWIPFGDGNGRFIVPGWASSGTYVSKGVPLTSGENRAHKHSWETTWKGDDVEYVGLRDCCDTDLADNRDIYHINGSTVSNSDTGSSGLPYIQMLACVSTDGTFDFKQPQGALLFNEIGCPTGTNVSLEFAGRFLVGLPNNATAGLFGSAIPLEAGAVETRTHDHPWQGSFSTRSCGIELVTGCCGIGYVGNGHYNISARSTDDSAVDFPYIEVPLCTSGVPSAMD